MSKPTKKLLNDSEKKLIANRYRIEKKLGSGNYGTAYLATDLKDPQDELKVLKQVSVGDMEADESIESVHEANLLSKLDNPYILKYHDSFLDNEDFCIVTEFCEGGDLDMRFKKLKKEGKRISEEQVLDWTVQLLSAVNYMHSRRVLHRDLKARNIFLKNELVKIGDFGISRILQGTMDMASTFTGTPYYMSPEVLKHEGYNSKSDVWSIGCLIYEMCSLKHAFEGQGLMGVMYKIVEGKVPELPTDIYSKDLNNILKKIFQKDPNKRPSSSELLREPLFVNHIKNMIKRLEAKQLDDLESTLVIRNDRIEIANALNSKVSLRELQAQRQQKLPAVEEFTDSSSSLMTFKKTEATPIVAASHDESSEDISPKLRPKTMGSLKYSTIVNRPGKEYTPKERLLLNKLKKADEEAAMIGQKAKENYEERMIRESFRKEGTIHLNNSTMIGESPKPRESYSKRFNQTYTSGGKFGMEWKEPGSYEKTEFHENTLRPAKSYDRLVIDHDDYDDDEGTLLQTLEEKRTMIQNRKMPIKSSKIPVFNNDARPITPLKTKIEQAFNEDGIPSDPQLANEYYENFDDFECDSSPERKPTHASLTSSSNFSSRNSLSKTVAPNRRKGAVTASTRRQPRFTRHHQIVESKNLGASRTYSNSQPRGSVAARLEYEQLIDMQKAIMEDSKINKNETFGDDSRTSAFGLHSRMTKVQNLRAQAIRILGPDVFQNCYDFLREQRRSNKNYEEQRVFEGLKKWGIKPSDGFLVDQLLFLEEL